MGHAYGVFITRTVTESAFVEVRASDLGEAYARACDRAGDAEFTRDDGDYFHEPDRHSPYRLDGEWRNPPATAPDGEAQP